jgi:pimeloyl-ACP methyl ester carboxylesterase
MLPSLFNHQRPDEHSAYAGLPVRAVTVGRAGDRVAVHVRGTLGGGRRPLLCVPGYQRNMSDFSAFLELFHRTVTADWPVVLVDLRGRGRSSDRADKSEYGTPADAEDLATVLAALAIPDAIILGQGYGGQVAMMLAVEHAMLVSGAVLIDAGPVSNPRALVRLRSNLEAMQGLPNVAAMRGAMAQIATTDYPGATDSEIETLALRSHHADHRGRVRGLFDPALIGLLQRFSGDDVLTPQWPFYDALTWVPLMVLRTQLTDLLRRETFEEMARRRRDAQCFTIAGQGSPALLNHADEVSTIASFVTHASERAGKRRG